MYHVTGFLCVTVLELIENLPASSSSMLGLKAEPPTPGVF